MCDIFDPGACIKEAAVSAVESMAQAMAEAAAWIIVESFTWWIDTDSSRELNTGVVNAVRDVTWPLTVTVAAAGMILLGIHMVISGAPDPLLSLGEGLAKLAFWTIAGTAVVTAAMQFAAAFSGWVLDASKSEQLGGRMLTVFGQPGIESVGAILLLSLLGFLAGVVQWLISMFREGAVVILAGCLPLAASGSLGLGRPWLGKIIAWCLALIFWQPAASLVYFAAFSVIENAHGGQETLVGLTMLLIAVFALPTLIKLFSWVVTASGAGGGAGGGRGTAAMAAYGLRSNARSTGGGRMSPGQHARLVESGLPRQGSGGGRGAGPGVSAGGAPGTGPSGAVPGSRTPASGATAKPGGPKAGPSGATGAAGTAGTPSAGTSGGAASAAKTAAGAAPSAGGTAGAAGGTSAGAAAGGAKAAAAAGPVGAAAAAAALAAGAGARAAGRAMTEGADTPPQTSEGAKKQ